MHRNPFGIEDLFLFWNQKEQAQCTSHFTVLCDQINPALALLHKRVSLFS